MCFQTINQNIFAHIACVCLIRARPQWDLSWTGPGFFCRHAPTFVFWVKRLLHGDSRVFKWRVVTHWRITPRSYWFWGREFVTRRKPCCLSSVKNSYTVIHVFLSEGRLCAVACLWIQTLWRTSTLCWSPWLYFLLPGPLHQKNTLVRQWIAILGKHHSDNTYIISGGFWATFLVAELFPKEVFQYTKKSPACCQRCRHSVNSRE